MFADTFQTHINLRYKRRTSVLAGILMLLVGSLIVRSGVDISNDQKFAMVLIVGGALLVGWIKRLAIDKQAGEIRLQIGFILPFYSRAYQIKKVKRIALLERYEKNRFANGSMRYNVRLVGIRNSTLLKSPGPWFARQVAERLATTIGVPMNNRIYGKSSIRQPDELETPLLLRWRKSGTSFQLPAAPQSTGVRVKRDGDRTSIYLKAESHNIFLLLIMLAGGLLVAFLVTSTTSGSPIFFVIFFGLFVYVIIRALLTFMGNSRIVIDARKVSVRLGISPFSDKLKLSEIEELIVARDGICLVGDDGALWFHWAEHKRDSEYLEKLIAYELSRRNSMQD